MASPPERLPEADRRPESRPAAAPLPRPQASGVDAATLAELMKAFTETTDRLREAYDKLQVRVAQLNAELEQKNRELARKNRMAVLGEMSACLAHEIRNPLGGMEIFAGVLRKDLEGRPDQQAIADKIISGVKHLNGLVEDMLTYGGSWTPVCRPCALADVVSEALAWAQPDLAPPLRLEAASLKGPQAGAVRVMADPAMLGRVVLNLVRNAAQAVAPAGTVTVELFGPEPSPEKSGGRQGGFRIVDTGPGIPVEVLDKLFVPFVTTKAKGTGLGLAIAQRIVEAHGGTLAGRNRPGGGAEFTVTLPLA